MFSLVIILVLTSFITILGCGAYIGSSGAALISISNIGLAFIISAGLLYLFAGVEVVTHL